MHRSRGTVLRAGHPRNRLLHERSADVIGPGAQEPCTGIGPEFHPGNLDVVDRPKEHHTSKCCDGQVVPGRRPWSRDASQIDR